MGRVFSVEEVGRGEVPTRTEVGEAATLFMEDMQRHLARGALLGAMLFGSVPAGVYTRRSDIDMLITTSDQLREGAQGELKQAAQRAQPQSEAKVEMALIIFSQSDAVAGRHTIDRLFAQHLRAVRGDDLTVIGRDPASLLDFGERNPRRLLESFLTNKAQKLARSTIADDPRDVKGIRRALETPAAVARRLSSYMELSAQISRAPLAVDREGLAEWLEYVVPGVASSQAALRRLDLLYDDLLDDVTEKGDIEGYDNGLSEIRMDALPRAQKLIRQVGNKALNW